MKQKLLKRTALLLCALVAGSGTAWGDTYKKVTASSEIAAGNKYILVCESKSVAMAVFSSGSYCPYVSISIRNNEVSTVDNINVLTIEAGENGYYFKQENGNYLYSSGAKSLKAENTTDKTLSTITEDYQITMGSSGKLQYNASSPRFCPYTSNQTAAFLYIKKEESSPLSSISVDASGATTVFHVGDAFTHDGAVVTATYEDESTKDVTANATFSTPDMTSAGTKTVTVSYTENEVEKTTSYDITVNAPATLESITLSGTYPTEFTQNDAFSAEGIVVTANYDDETTKDVTADATFSEYDMSTAGEQTVTVSYGGKTATYDITVNAYVQPTEFDINLNDSFFGTSYGGPASGITDDKPVVGSQDNVSVTYAGGGNHYIKDSQIRFYPSNKLTFEAPSGYNITKIVFTADGTWAATISANSGTYTSSTKTWEGEATSVLFTGSGSSRCDMSKATITLEAPKVLSSIALSGTYPTTFHTGDAFSHEGMIVTATYEGGKTKDVTASATFSGYDMSTTGVQTVTVSYTENEVTKTATYDITVNAPAVLTSIALSGDYPTEFEQGDDFSAEGIVVTASFDDETTSNVTADATFTGYDLSELGVQTVTVSYTNGGVTKTATYTITVNVKKGTAERPYTVAEAIDYINTLGSSTSASDVYVSGIISQVDSYNATYSSITYWISDDGTTTNQMEVYSGKGLNGADFSAVTDLAVGDVVTVKGKVKKYSGTPEFDKNNQLVSLSVPVTVTTAGFATYCSGHALDFTDAGIKAYLGAIDGENLTFSPASTVPANTGMLLVKAGGDTENIPVAASATGTSCLTGVLAETTIDSEDYILNMKDGKPGFYPAGTHTTLGAHKAYIDAETAGAVKGFVISFEGDETLVEAVKAIGGSSDIFNLAGQRVNRAQKGVFIQNGKKFIVK